MGFEIRRIVTGHDAEGSAIVHSDSQLSAQQVPADTAWFNKIWSTEGWPADNSDLQDGALRDTGLANANGSVLRIVEMAPGHRSPMHRTQSLDYGIVLSGEVQLELDAGRTVLLKSGDVVIQRGTIHAWSNRGTSAARMAFVLLSAAPLEPT
jgi:quercetin dioxygenase-like cupin family protein